MRAVTVVSVNAPPRQPSADAERLLGAAPTSPTIVVGDGTDPNARTPLDYPPGVGHTRFNLLLWAVVLITALVALDDVLGAVR